MRKYDTFLFDADGTLFDFERSEEFAFYSAFKDAKLPQSKEHLKIYRDINNNLWYKHEHGEITQAELKTLRFKLLFEEIGVKYNPAVFNSLYLTSLGQSAYLTDGSLRTLKLLKMRNKKIYIITNGLAVSQRARLNKCLLKDYIDDVFISEEIGSQKPDSGFFTYVMNNITEKNKEKMLVIGDSLNADIFGGNRSGIDTLWYNPKNLVNSSHIKPTYETGKLLSVVGMAY